jgi:hypothetical protein
MTTNLGTATGMSLSPRGMVMGTREECMDGICPKFRTGFNFLAVPAYDFSIHPGLTFSVWFKPTGCSGDWCRVFDMRDPDSTMNVQLLRQQSLSYFYVQVRRPGQSTSPALYSAAGTWVEGRYVCLCVYVCMCGIQLLVPGSRAGGYAYVRVCACIFLCASAPSWSNITGSVFSCCYLGRGQVCMCMCVRVCMCIIQLLVPE